MKSYKKILSIMLVFISTSIFAQEMNTIFSKGNSNENSMGAYGGPFINATQLNNNWGISIGGKGGVIINRKLAIGGIGMGTASEYNFVGDNFDGNTDASLDVSYGLGGIFVEYIFNITNSIHFSVPLNLMAGRVSIKESEVDTESSSAFTVEPGVSLEFNFTKAFIPGISLSYRQFLGSSLNHLNDKELSGLNIGIVFKFGSF